MSNSCFQQNMNALQAVYPGIAQLMQTTSPRADESKEKPAELKWNDETELHILYRAAISPQLLQLDEAISLANLRDNRNRRLLLIEDRVEVFCWWMETADLRAWLQSERCLFLVHPSWQNAVQSLLKRYPEISAATLQVHKGNAEIDNETCDAIATEFASIHQKLIHTLNEYTLSNRRPKPPYPKTIRFMAAGHNYLQDACCAAVQSMGYDAKRLNWRDPLYRFIRNMAWIHAHRDSAMDTVFFLNTAPNLFTHKSYFHDLNLRSICWFVDNPKRFVQCEQNDFKRCDVIGVFDKTYIPYLTQHADCPIIEARTGYGIDETCGGASLDFSSIDVAFVGELGAKATLTFEQAYHKINPRIVEVSNIILSSLDMNQTFVLDGIVPQQISEIDDLKYTGNLVTYIENKAAYLRRKYYLDSLADQNLHIFGDAEWANPAWVGKAASCYTGKRLDYFTELPRLYATAKINLNIFHPQCVSAPNPRVYDVLACGGFLLTSHNPGLEDEFVIGEDLDVFHSPDELRDKINYYLSHPDERRQIAQNGKQKALANCAYSDRMTLFFSALCA